VKKELSEILVCPLCNSKLSESKDKKQLVCRFDRVAYQYDEGIPVLLPESGEALTQEKMEEILG